MKRIAILTALSLSLSLGLGVAPVAGADEAWSPLVDPARAAALIDEGDAVVLDIRSVKAYGAGHVDTAVNVPYHAWRGPEESPGEPITSEKVTALLQEAGIESDIPVLVTFQGADQTDFGAAARVYWTLKSAGVERIAILNGGIEAWTRSGRDLSSDEWSNIPSDEVFTLSDRWTITREGVEAVTDGTAEAILIDARPGEFFTGKVKHELAQWAGSLKDALNLPHEQLFAAPGILAADAAAVRQAAKAAGWEPGGPEIVSFCNTGHWAATNWFALSEIAGIETVKLYPESMVGWTRANRLAQNAN